MSQSDSDDDVEPGSSAEALLQRLRHRPPLGDGPTFGHQSRKELLHALDPGSLEAQLLGAGVTSPFNTWPLEEVLRQQAFSAVDRRHHEIETFERGLQCALAELQRVRAAEESRLAARVQEATRRFGHQMEALQQQYLQEVDKLRRHTVAELHRQRALSEATIAARVRALHAELQYARPAGLMAAGSMGAAAAAAAASARDSSPGPGLGARGLLFGGSGWGSGAGSWKPTATSTRMRSAPSVRGGVAAGPAPAGPGGAFGEPRGRNAAAAGATDGGGGGGGGGSPAAAATPPARPLNRTKLETGEGLW